MKTIPEIVAREIEENAFLRDVLHSGLGNISAIAESIRGAVEAQSGTPSSTAAIGMALRRLVRAAPRQPVRRKSFPAHIDISTRTGIYEAAFARTERTIDIGARVRAGFTVEKGDFFSIAEGSYEVVVFTSQRNKARLKAALGKQKITSEIDDLACVTVNWPPVTKDIPGIYHRVTEALAARDISIQSFHTIGAEMMIFVREDSLNAAHEALSGLLKKKKQ